MSSNSKERSKTFYKPSQQINYFSTINTEESLISNRNIFSDSTPTKVQPFSSYRDEQTLKNNQNYFEVSMVIDEMIFIVEISSEMENSLKIDNFLQNHNDYFSKYMRAFEDNFLINKSCNLEKETHLLKHLNVFEFYDRGFFTSKYIQRFKKLQEMYQANSYVGKNVQQIENRKCTDINCQSQTKIFKHKM